MLIGIANAAKFVSINSALPPEVLAICTGSETKFISQSIYFETGNIVEVKLSDWDLTDTSLQHFQNDITCPVDQGLEKSNTLQNQQISPNIIILSYVVSFVKLGQQPHSSFAFVLLPSRAPPAL